MGRKSAKYIAKILENYSVNDVYEIWQDMGIVSKDNFGGWKLTNLGKAIGGRMSKGNYVTVPTFDEDLIIDKMISFCKSKGVK